MYPHPYYSSASYPSQQTWFKLPAHSSAFIDKSIEDGDKIILPPSILTAVVQRYADRHMPQPLIFEINNNAAVRTSHCGVLEFSAPDEKAYLPHWMMENLLLQEGREVRLRVKDVPKATEVRLQPVERSFTQLPTPRESMEWALRKFTALTVGDEVRVTLGEGRSYHLRVLSLQPVMCNPAAGSVVNTSLAVEFAEPLEPVRKGEGDGDEVKEGERQEGRVEAEGYHYYRFKLEDRSRAVKVDCVASQGAPDVYVSAVHSKPNIAQHDWKTSLIQPTITIPPSLSDASSSSSPPSSSWYYLSVHAYKQPAVYSLLIRTFKPPASSASTSTSSSFASSASSSSSSSSSPVFLAGSALSGITLGSSSSPSPGSSVAGSSTADSTYCSNCRLLIPNKQFTLHSIQCPRLSVFCEQCGRAIKRSEAASHAHCPTCNAVVHKDELQKHVDLLHASSRCAQCGELVTGEAMPAHLAESCALRLLPCSYCHMRLPARDLAEHLQYEAAKSVPCERCGASVSRKRMNIHLAAVHNINPSLRPGDRSSMGRAIAGAAAVPPTPAPPPAASSAATPPPVARLDARDVDMERALRESRREAGLAQHEHAADEDEDEDAVLQRVMRQSELEADGAGQLQRSDSPEQEAEDMFSDSEAVLDEQDEDDWAEVQSGAGGVGEERNGTRAQGGTRRAARDEGEEWAREGGGGSVAPAPTTAADTAASVAAAAERTRAGRREPSTCPYCQSELPDYEALIAHMAVCDQMED